MTCSCVDMTTVAYDENMNAKAFLLKAKCASCIKIYKLPSLDAIPENMTIDEFIQERYRFYNIWNLYILSKY